MAIKILDFAIWDQIAVGKRDRIYAERKPSKK
jgi:hypothetical protein